MVNQELLNEYTALLHDKISCLNTLATLKDGYISTKTISGKKYAYLQYRIEGKLFSEYIRDESLPQVRNELVGRTKIIEKLRIIDERINKLEFAAEILDVNLRRKLTALRRCAMMDGLPIDQRERSLAFSNAMTALEGIPASEQTENNLSRWANGEYSFQDSYLNTLQEYNLAEV